MTDLPLSALTLDAVQAAAVTISARGDDDPGSTFGPRWDHWARIDVAVSELGRAIATDREPHELVGRALKVAARALLLVEGIEGRQPT